MSLLNSGTFSEAEIEGIEMPNRKARPIAVEKIPQPVHTNVIDIHENFQHLLLNVSRSHPTQSNTNLSFSFVPNFVPHSFPPSCAPAVAIDAPTGRVGSKDMNRFPVDLSFHCDWSDSSMVKSDDEDRYGTENKARSDAMSSCFSQQSTTTFPARSTEYPTLDELLKVEISAASEMTESGKVYAVNDESQASFVNSALNVTPETFDIIRSSILSKSNNIIVAGEELKKQHRHSQRRRSESDVDNNISLSEVSEDNCRHSNLAPSVWDSLESHDNLLQSTSRLVDNLIITSVYSTCVDDFKQLHKNRNDGSSRQEKGNTHEAPSGQFRAHRDINRLLGDFVQPHQNDSDSYDASFNCGDNVMDEGESAGEGESKIVSSSGVPATFSHKPFKNLSSLFNNI